MTEDMTEDMTKYAQYARYPGPSESIKRIFIPVEDDGNTESKIPEDKDDYKPYDYSDQYYKGDKNRNPHYDFPLSRHHKPVPNSTMLTGGRIITEPHKRLNEVRAPSSGKLTKNELRNLYSAWRENKPSFSMILESLAAKLYKLVLKECTYEYRGKRDYVTGGTAIMQATVSSYIRFIKAYEDGSMSMSEFDNVINSIHNNGSMAPLFMEVEGGSEEEVELYVQEFLDELGGK